jgi:hypothetical protein
MTPEPQTLLAVPGLAGINRAVVDGLSEIANRTGLMEARSSQATRPSVRMASLRGPLSTELRS